MNQIQERTASQSKPKATRIKIGQLGIGHNHAAAKMATFRKLSDLYEVVGVAEPDPDWRERRGDHPAYSGLTWMTEEQLLNTEGLQVVAVETDVPDLTDAAMRCLRAGMHLHLDKPGGETMAPFGEMLAEADRRGLAVQMGYMFRTNPAMQFCLRAVREGWLGEIFEVHCVMSRMDGDDYRKWLSQFKGGAMYIFGGHLIDLVVAMLGVPSRITPYQRRTRPDADDLFDSGLAVLEYPKATATIRTAVVEVDGMKRRQLVVCGDAGTIEIRPIEPPRLRLTLAEPRGQYPAGTHEVALPPISGRYDEELAQLARVVRGETENPYATEREIVLQECLLRASGYGLD